MKKRHLVEVTWVDSASTPGWLLDEDIPRALLTCWTAGYLVHSDRQAVVVALNCSSDKSKHDFGDVITIPRACVRSIRRLT